MKVTIESTTKVVSINGIPARQWQGATDSGIPVVCLITRIAVPDGHDTSQFEAELKEQQAPRFDDAFPIRMVI